MCMLYCSLPKINGAWRWKETRKELGAGTWQRGFGEQPVLKPALVCKGTVEAEGNKPKPHTVAKSGRGGGEEGSSEDDGNLSHAFPFKFGKTEFWHFGLACVWTL